MGCVTLESLIFHRLSAPEADTNLYLLFLDLLRVRPECADLLSGHPKTAIP